MRVLRYTFAFGRIESIVIFVVFMCILYVLYFMRILYIAYLSIFIFIIDASKKIYIIRPRRKYISNLYYYIQSIYRNSSDNF